MGSLDDAIKRLNQPIQEVRVNIVKTPVLECIVTGRARMTNRKYLEKKAESCPGNDINEKVSNFQKHYVCKAAAKLLRQGLSITETREALDVSPDQRMNEQMVDTKEYIDYLLKCNGSRTRSANRDQQISQPDVYGDY